MVAPEKLSDTTLKSSKVTKNVVMKQTKATDGKSVATKK